MTERDRCIKEVDLGKGKIVQYRKDEHYYRIIIGKRYIDNPEHPDIFEIERSLTMTNKERLAVIDLLT